MSEPLENNAIENKPILIKKYSNRRLYDTTTSQHLTCEDLSRYIKDGKDFVVQDVETKKDITRNILLQILIEEESKNEGLLSLPFLKSLISFYGTNISAVIPSYLDQSMDVFVANQNHLREYFKDKFTNIFADDKIIKKRNIEK